MKYSQDFNNLKFNKLLYAIKNNIDIKFNDKFYNHVMYLENNNKCKFYIRDNSLGFEINKLYYAKVYPLEKKNYTLYRAVGFNKMLDILKNKTIKNYYYNKDDFNFNKTFLGNDFDMCIENAKLTNTCDNIIYFVLEINTQDLEIYHYITSYPKVHEFITWGDIGIKYIKNIYMVDDKFRITEIGNPFNLLERRAIIGKD